MFDPRRHHRRSVRLAQYDYGAAGAYFVTACTAKHRMAFGRIERCEMRLHPYGRMVEEEWMRTTEVRPTVALDEFVVMPNHFHAIVWITKTVTPDETSVGAHGCAPNRPTPETPQSDAQAMGSHSGAHSRVPLRRPRSLSSLMAQWKATVTRRINLERAVRNLPPVVVWQRSFHDRIIRDERELEIKRRYIIENPLHWERDKYHP
jgi:REP element-mobilizing transposase RayT